MRVIWTPEAQQDRADIFDYIAANNPRAALLIDKLFSNATAKLALHPKLGRPGKIPGTRELIPHESYRLVYEIEHQTVWILTLVHTARQWPPILGHSVVFMNKHIDSSLNDFLAEEDLLIE